MLFSPFLSAYSKGAQGVLKKGVLTLDGSELHVTIKKPAKKIPVDPKRLLVKGLSEATTRDALASYMEVVSSLEVLRVEFGEQGCALITFAESYSKLRLVFINACSVIVGIDVCSNFFIYYPQAFFVKKKGGCGDFRKPLQTVSFSEVNIATGV